MYRSISTAQIAEMWLHWKDNRVGEMRIAYLTNLGLAILAVFLRLISRRLLGSRLQADDWCIVAALIGIAVGVGINWKQTTMGGGRHVILLQNPELFAKLIIVFNEFYVTSTFLVKQSFLLMYRRLFGTSQVFNHIFWYTTVFMIIDHGIQIILIPLPCRPISAIWDPYIPGKCVNISASSTAFAAINVVLDFWLLFIPIPLLWNLRLERKRKIQLTGLFALGGFICVGSIYRATQVPKFGKPDASWLNVDPGIWAVTEVCMGIVSACLTTYRPLFVFLRQGHYCRTGSKATDTCAKCRSRANSKMGSKYAAGSGTHGKYAGGSGTHGSSNMSSGHHARSYRAPSEKNTEFITTSNWSSSWGWKRLKAGLSSKRDRKHISLNEISRPVTSDRSAGGQGGKGIQPPLPAPKENFYISQTSTIADEGGLDTIRRASEDSSEIRKPPPLAWTPGQTR